MSKKLEVRVDAHPYLAKWAEKNGIAKGSCVHLTSKQLSDIASEYGGKKGVKDEGKTS